MQGWSRLGAALHKQLVFDTGCRVAEWARVMNAWGE